MDKHEKVQSLNIVMNGITINGPMFDIHDNGVVENHYHINKSTDNVPMTISDKKMKDVLVELLDFIDENGNKLFTDKCQWYAVYRVLSEQHGYPTKMTEFCQVMTNMGMEDVTPPCKHTSVTKASQNVPQLTCKTNLWKTFLTKSNEQTKKQIVVALKLMDLLSEKG